MLINDRVQIIIKANNLTASEFAQAIGVKRSNLSHVLSGRNKPSLDFLAKIITAYPNVNASWLLTGETRDGEFKAEKKESRVQEVKLASAPETSDRVEKIVVFYTDGTFKQYSSSQK